jgi:hypothetical protein
LIVDDVMGDDVMSDYIALMMITHMGGVQLLSRHDFLPSLHNE